MGGEPCPCEHLTQRELDRFWRRECRDPDPAGEFELRDWRCPRCRHRLPGTSDRCTWCEPSEQDRLSDIGPKRSGGGWLVLIGMLILLGSGGAYAATRPPTPATAELEAIVTADAARVSGLAGHWVVQLESWSSRPDGRGDDAALRDLRNVPSDRLPVTFRSGRFVASRNGSSWVTVRAQTFPTASDADAWCSRQGLPRQHCLPVHLDPA